MDSRVEIALALLGLSQFVSGTEKASTGVKGLGTATEETGKKAKLGWKSVALWGGAAGIAYGAGRFIKSAVSSTTDLAKATIGLQRTTGLDAQTASAWVGVLKERGISTDQFRMSLSKMATMMRSAQGGSKTAIQAFHDLGISQKLVASGNTEAVLEATANSFDKMGASSTRTALAQALLGRAGNKLLPLLSKGSAGIREAIGVQVKYHNVLSGKSVKSTADLIAKQREMNAAYAGVKLQLGTALLPVMLALASVILKVVNALEPLLHNSKLLTAVIIAMTAAFIAYKIVCIAATIANLGLDASMLPIIGIVAAIVVGVALLGLAFYEAYKHVAFFRHGVQAAWSWIKKNWPLLLGIIAGPIGLAVVLVIRHFDQVKKVALAIVHAITRAFKELVNFVKGIPSKIGGVAGTLLHKIPGYGAASSVASHLNPFHWASGGVQPRPGPALVGEAGPELVNLPGGAQITPLAAGGGFTVEVPVYLDKQMIAKAVAQVTADKLARR